MKKAYKFIILLILVFITGYLIFLSHNNSRLGTLETEIALSICDTKNPRMAALLEDILECVGQSGMTIQWRDADTDINQQKDDIKQLMEYQPEYLVVVPVKTYGLETLLDEFDEETTIIFLDRKIDNYKNIKIGAYIGTDAVCDGAQCADLLAGFFGDNSGSILEIQGEEGSSLNKERSIGFRNQLVKYPNLEIGDVIEGNGTRSTTQSNLLTYLQGKEGAVDAIFANSDEEGLGALAALEELGLSDEIPIVSINGVQDVKKALLSGVYYGCVEATPFLGEQLIKYIDSCDARSNAQSTENEGAQDMCIYLESGEIYRVDNAVDMLGY